MLKRITAASLATLLYWLFHNYQITLDQIEEVAK